MAETIVLQTDTLLSRQYDAAAPGWQKTIACLRYDHAYTNTLRRMNYLGLEPNANVLDAGIGSGALSYALARGLGAVHVTGVDIAPKMLLEARRTLSDVATSFKPYCADVQALSLPNEGFDAVVSAHLLEHFAIPAVALGELYRVLRPGAPLFVMVTRQGLGGRWIQRTWPVHPLTPNELRQTLQQAGFRDVEIVAVQGSPWCRLLSVAALAWKE